MFNKFFLGHFYLKWLKISHNPFLLLPDDPEQGKLIINIGWNIIIETHFYLFPL